jgi:hypothetical protein
MRTVTQAFLAAALWALASFDASASLQWELRYNAFAFSGPDCVNGSYNPPGPWTRTTVPASVVSPIVAEGHSASGGSAPPAATDISQTHNTTVTVSGPWACGIVVIGRVVEVEDNPCTALAGQTKILNETQAWARTSTPDANDIVSEVTGGAASGATSSCDGQCTVTYQAVDSCWRSQIPAANGLHRVSCDLRVAITSTQCTSKASPQDSTVAPPPCPGYVGNVNGKPVCVGTSSAPLPQGATPSTQPPSAAGNPSAGDKPGSGSGSGSTGATRTPTSGDGGNAGGGSSAATPGGGSEGNGQTAGTRGGATVITGEVEVDIETCGLPGKPPCKIDETGTPDGTSLQAKVTAIGTAGTALVEGVNDVSQPSTFGWVFGVSLPESACSALQFYKPGGTWSIDPCNSSLVNTMRLLLAWFFALATALYCWRTVTAAVGND